MKRGCNAGKLDKPTSRSNQPAFLYGTAKTAFLYGTAKTRRFSNTEEITFDNLQLRPIVSSCGSFCYDTASYLASYLMPLTSKEFCFKNTTDFAERLTKRTLDDDEMLVSYDVSSLFTQVLLDETLEYRSSLRT